MVGTTRSYVGHGALVGRTVGESVPWWDVPPRAREGAPNIVVVLMDDMGFSDVGAFGSEIETLVVDGLARRGVRFANYHTNPLCSPSRASLLTGLNPHNAGFGFVANADPGFPGWALELADDAPTLAESLRASGYATYAVGKWHLTKDSTMNEGAYKRSWPLQRGFDRFYGFLEGLTSLHLPYHLVRDNSPVAVDQYPDGYYLTDDITDEAISMVKGLRANSDKPFFLYYAHGAVHGPLQAKAEDIAKYRGRYGRGWDAVREERFQRQIASGLFPEGTELPPRNGEVHHDVEPWDSLPEEERELYARMKEVYAAMVDNVDQNLGRLLATIEALGELDNTLVVFTSDNGGTGEGGPQGTRSYYRTFSRGPHLPREWHTDVPRDLDSLGGPDSTIHYPRGWGMASNAPFRLYKGNTHAGGVRVPFIVSWPAGLGELAGQVRTQYQYVTDLYPTLLELAGVDRLSERQGKEARPLDGFSFTGPLRDPEAASTHVEQYCEMTGNRSYYRDGWKLVSLHQPGTSADDAPWELYNVATDPTEAHDVAAEHPDLVKDLAAAWERAAWDNRVFPVDDRGHLFVSRPPSDRAFSRPVTLLPGTPSLERYRSAKLVALRSFDVETRLTYAPGDQGVLFAHGDLGGGYNLHLEDGRLRFVYNEYGALHEADAGELAPGEHLVTLKATILPDYRWRFDVLVDGERRTGLDEVLILFGFAPAQGIDVGADRRNPVSWPLYQRHGAFPYTGSLTSVTYLPGAPAPYDPAEVLALLREAGAAFE
ncbi:arylsulfatase [Actinocorallia sp. API 0066]|uniref:arylsulfatase n=1 Tax=Actinocorallia sp. API 0066 TaxID=2896846 RepID=UPI001E412C20|nr:arylsulfatase [Actinocorallia sp. API 0066]MCD0450507.1 arylsulfatase [Actinocorallia sp. API 0066]